MKPLKVLGEIDDEGQPKESMYAIGTVTQRGSNVMHGKNHSNTVDFQLFHKNVRYLPKSNEAFPDLYHFGLGRFYPHITTEVD